MGRAKFTLVNPADGGKGVLFKDVAGMFTFFIKNNIYFMHYSTEVLNV